MKAYKFRGKIRRLNNNRGIALASLVLTFAFLAILTTSVVAMVYSDNMFSQVDERQRKAYYAARSAISTVEAAIQGELDELEYLKNSLDSAAASHSADPTDEARVIWELARDDYNVQLSYIRGTVLPTAVSGALSHDVSIAGAGFDTVSNDFTVTVDYLSGEEFRLEAEATVKGQTSRVARLLNIEDTPGSSSINLSQMVGLFDNAIWVADNLTTKNNTSIKDGNISYGGSVTKGANFKLTNGEEVKRSQPVTLPTPDEFLLEISGYSGEHGVLPTKTQAHFNSLNQGNITSAANGYYNMDWKPKNTTTTFNAQDTDVIMRFKSVSMDNNVKIIANTGTAGNNVVLYFDYLDIEKNNMKFTVTGKGSLIIYIKTAGSFEGNNTKIDCGSDAEAYIIVDEGADFKDKNNFNGNHLYLYAPLSDMEWKNNTIVDGAVIAKNMIVTNNASVTYRPPSNNIQVAETNVGGTILSLETHSFSLGHNSRWLKD